MKMARSGNPFPDLSKLKVIRTSERGRELGLKGGAVCSPAKKLAAKIRYMKRMGMKGKDTEWFLDRLNDPDTNIFQLQLWLDDLMANARTPAHKLTAIQTAIQLHKAHFGEKTTSTNLNVNVGIDEWERRLMGSEGLKTVKPAPPEEPEEEQSEE